jgi:hypothetical protein
MMKNLQNKKLLKLNFPSQPNLLQKFGTQLDFYGTKNLNLIQVKMINRFIRIGSLSHLKKKTFQLIMKVMIQICLLDKYQSYIIRNEEKF